MQAPKSLKEEIANIKTQIKKLSLQEELTQSLINQSVNQGYNNSTHNDSLANGGNHSSRTKKKKDYNNPASSSRRSSQPSHRQNPEPEYYEDEDLSINNATQQLQIQLKRNADLEKKYNKLKVEVKKAIYQMDLLEAQNNELLDENEGIVQENNQLRERIKRYKSEKKATASAAASIKQDRSPSPEKIQSMRNTIKELQQKNQQYQQSNTELLKKIEVIEESLLEQSQSSKNRKGSTSDFDTFRQREQQFPDEIQQHTEDDDEPPISTYSQLPEGTEKNPSKLVDFLVREAKFWKNRAQQTDEKLKDFNKLETTIQVVKQENEKLNHMAFDRVKEITDLKSEINGYKKEIEHLNKFIKDAESVSREQAALAMDLHSRSPSQRKKSVVAGTLTPHQSSSHQEELYDKVQVFQSQVQGERTIEDPKRSTLTKGFKRISDPTNATPKRFLEVSNSQNQMLALNLPSNRSMKQDPSSSREISSRSRQRSNSQRQVKIEEKVAVAKPTSERQRFTPREPRDEDDEQYQEHNSSDQDVEDNDDDEDDERGQGIQEEDEDEYQSEGIYLQKSQIQQQMNQMQQQQQQQQPQKNKKPKKFSNPLQHSLSAANSPYHLKVPNTDSPQQQHQQLNLTARMKKQAQSDFINPQFYDNPTPSRKKDNLKKHNSSSSFYKQKQKANDLSDGPKILDLPPKEPSSQFQIPASEDQESEYAQGYYNYKPTKQQKKKKTKHKTPKPIESYSQEPTHEFQIEDERPNKPNNNIHNLDIKHQKNSESIRKTLKELEADRFEISNINAAIQKSPQLKKYQSKIKQLGQDIDRLVGQLQQNGVDFNEIQDGQQQQQQQQQFIAHNRRASAGTHYSSNNGNQYY